MKSHTTRSGPSFRMRRSAQWVRSMFDRIATRYDLANHVLSLGLDQYWRIRMARCVNGRTGGRILDVCTGTGDSLLCMRQPWSIRVGLDFSSGMLMRARRKSRARGIAAVWVQGDATSLPFPDATFDAVTIAFGLRNLEHPCRGLEEFYRVLRPGGICVVLEFTLPRWRPWRWVYGFYLRRILPILGTALTGDRSAYQHLVDSILAFPQYRDLAVWMTETGFVDVRFIPLTGGVATLYIGHKNGKKFRISNFGLRI